MDTLLHPTKSAKALVHYIRNNVSADLHYCDQPRQTHTEFSLRDLYSKVHQSLQRGILQGGGCPH